MKDTSLKVFNFLKDNYGTEFTKAQIAEKTGLSIPVITGSVNGLRNHGLVEERVEMNGNVPTRYATLNAAGKEFVPN